jgi:hypothetical protein
VHGVGIDVGLASPEIVDYRGLKITGSPTSLLAPR